MFLKSIKKIANYYFQFFRKRQKLNILIIDDFLPSRLSPWRSYEFNEILLNIKNSSVATDLRNFKHYSDGKPFEQNLKDLAEFYPALSSKIHKLSLFENSNINLAYTLFYDNIRLYFDHFERHKIPFAFTLYPGGGFFLNNENQNALLNRIFRSPYFKGVIVTQKVIYDYLIEKEMCNQDRIRLINGSPLKIENYNSDAQKDYSSDYLNILFMANKYMQYGFDKGFDIFQIVALGLLNKDLKIKFHVIGGYTLEDLNFSSLKDFFIFHGSLTEDKLHHVLNKTQICVSPNRPNALAYGAIDGFPLASMVTAGLYKNALLMTDPFNQAEAINLIDGQDYIKINLNPIEIVDKVLFLIEKRNNSEDLANNGFKKLKTIYSYENQIIPRLKFFKEIIDDTRN